MKQILIGKSTPVYGQKNGTTSAISGINELNLLDDGAVAVFTEGPTGMTLVTAANAATVLDDVKKVIIAVGNYTADSKSILSVPIPRDADFKMQAYIAPVKLRKFVGYDGTTAGTSLNLPSTLVVGTEATLKIINTTIHLRTTGDEVERYNDVVRTGDTNATLMTRLIAKVNANADRVADATAIGSVTGIQLDARNYGSSFDIALDGILISSTKEEPEAIAPQVAGISVALKYGHGTYDQIAALEEAYSAERGNTNKLVETASWYNKNSLAVLGQTYNTYTIAWNGKKTSSLGGSDTYRFEIVIPIPATATQQANLINVLTEVFGGITSTSPMEKGS